MTEDGRATGAVEETQAKAPFEGPLSVPKPGPEPKQYDLHVPLPLTSRCDRRQSVDSLFGDDVGKVDFAVKKEKKQVSVCSLFIFSFLVCGLIAGACVVFLSDMCYGREFLEQLRKLSIVGQAFFGVALACFGVLYLADFFCPVHLPGRVLAIRENAETVCLPACVLGCLSCWLGCFFIAGWYTWAPLLSVIFVCPIGLLAVQHFTTPGVSVRLAQTEVGTAVERKELIDMLNHLERHRVARPMFHAGAWALSIVALIVFAVWLYWALGTQRGQVQTVRQVPKDERMERYILWVTPPTVSLSYFVFAVLLRLNLRLGRLKDSREAVPQSVGPAARARQSQTSKGVRPFVVEDSALGDFWAVVGWLITSILVLFSINYVAYSIFSEIQIIGSMVQAFLGGVVFTSSIVIFYNFRGLLHSCHGQILTHPMAKMVWEFRHSVWAKAMIIFAFSPFAPIVGLVSAINQCVRRRRKVYRTIYRRREEAKITCQIIKDRTDDEYMLTPRMNAIFEHLCDCSAIDVVTKMYVLALVCITLRVSPVCLNVFLSWISNMMASFSFFLLAVAMYSIGILLFLLPPVPGAPIYLFAGLLFAGQGMRLWGEGTGFWLGYAIAVALGLGLKLTACAIQQKVIGERLGTFLLVRQTVGVHKPFIRAIEKVLRRPGLSTGKVLILVGGPDWPTSVLAGILRVSVVQCLMGTVPVALYIVPFTATGSFYLRSDSGEIWNTLGELMVEATAMMSIVLYAAIWWIIQATMEEHAEELQAPMEQYLELDWMDYVSAEVAKTAIVKLEDMPCIMQAFFFGGCIALIGVVHAFYWAYPLCFGSFAVTDKVTSLHWYGKENSLVKFYGLIGLCITGAGLLGGFTVALWKVWKTQGPRREAWQRAAAHEEAWKAFRRKEAQHVFNALNNRRLSKASAPRRFGSQTSQQQQDQGQHGKLPVKSSHLCHTDTSTSVSKSENRLELQEQLNITLGNIVNSRSGSRDDNLVDIEFCTPEGKTPDFPIEDAAAMSEGTAATFEEHVAIVGITKDDSVEGSKDSCPRHAESALISYEAASQVASNSRQGPEQAPRLIPQPARRTEWRSTPASRQKSPQADVRADPHPEAAHSAKRAKLKKPSTKSGADPSGRPKKKRQWRTKWPTSERKAASAAESADGQPLDFEGRQSVLR